MEWTRLANWTLPLDAQASMLSRSDTMMQSGFLTFNFWKYSQVEDIRRLLSCSAFRKDWHAAKRSRSLKQEANHLGEHGSRVVIHVFHICRSIDVRWLFQLQPQLLKHWSFELGVVGLSKLWSYLGACLQTDGRNALETYIAVIRSISLTSDLSLNGSKFSYCQGSLDGPLLCGCALCPSIHCRCDPLSPCPVESWFGFTKHQDMGVS